MLLTAHKKGSARGRYLREHLEQATQHSFRQFRYVFFLKSSWRKRLRPTIQPYPQRQAA